MPSDRILWLATGNKAKLREARTILSESQIRVRQVHRPKLEIQSYDLAEIASFAADNISRGHTGMVVVEDSGLFISSLSGFPGPYTAYAYQTIGVSGILRLLTDSPNKKADFKAAIAVSRSGQTLNTFIGQIKGTIAKSQRGENGFGFDPIFIPMGKHRTFGEMSAPQKNMQSHRRRGFKKLAKWYLSF